MGTVLTKMGILPVLVTLSAAAAFTVWLPGGLDGEEDINAREKRDEEYDYYGYDDTFVPSTSPDQVLDLDENGFVLCQSRESCPADFTLTTTKVTYSCNKDGLCEEEVDERDGTSGGKPIEHLTSTSGASYITIGNPTSVGVCHPLTCKRKGKCCLLVTVGHGGRRFGCPPYC